MSLLASDVKLPTDLASTFSGIGTNAYDQIGANYKKAKGQADQEAVLRGMPGAGSYSQDRLGAQEGLDIGNLETGLGGQLGETGYKEAIAKRNFGQQKQISDIIGDAMAPSTLEQIFAGLGGGANAAGNMLPFYQSMMKPGTSTVTGSGVADSSGAGATGYDPGLGYYYL